MVATMGNRLKHAWNAFVSVEEKRREPSAPYTDYGPSYSVRPDRRRMQVTNERSVIGAIYNRLGIDAAAMTMKHVKLDDQERYQHTMRSGLNNCLTVEANKDQSGRAFIQDVAMTMFDKGVVAIVPVDTTSNPDETGSWDVKTLRAAEILQWYPDHVRLYLYNDRKGLKEEIILPKDQVAIAENPLYAVMNEPNSTLTRLKQKLHLLDAVDTQSASGKLDLFIQLPYVIKNEARREQAEKRRKDIEIQLKDSQYGIAYTDGSEKITQLNRPAENNLFNQVKYLTEMLYSQLGLTPSIMDGTADEKTMLNYHNRTIEPVLAAITGAMLRTFLTQTARTQGQSIVIFRDPFRLVPISDIAEIADKFTRNEIATANEIRGVIGWMPSDDPKADELQNSNMPVPEANSSKPEKPPEKQEDEVEDNKEGDLQNES